MLRRILSAVGAAGLGVLVLAPPFVLAGGSTPPGIVQSGTVTPGNCAQFSASGVAIDAGSTCGTGTAGVIQSTGTPNQVLVNGNTSAHTGATTYSLPNSVIIGTPSTATGTFGLNGTTSGTVTIQPQAAAGTYNFNLPTTAGASGAPLLSGGGGSTPMSFGTRSGNTTAFGTVSGSLTSGNCIDIDASGNFVDAGAPCGTTSLSFSGLTSGTNTTAAMVVGTGGSLTISGSGTINATTLGGATFATPSAIGGTTPAAGAFTTLSATSTVSGAGFTSLFASPPAIGGTAAAAGSFTTLGATGTITASGLSSGVQTSCIGLDVTNHFVLATGACGISGGGSAFNALTSGTNTTATMVVGTGGTLSATGSGSINATQLGGATFANPGAIGGGTAAAGNFTTLGATGAITITGLSSGTQVSCLGLDSGNHVVLNAAACGSGGGGSLTVTDGTHSVGSTTTLTTGTGFVVGGSAGSATLNLTVPENAQTAPYTINATDNSKVVTITTTGTVTVPQAGTGSFTTGYSTSIVNASSGNVTLSTTTSSFNGLGASIVLQPGGSANIESNGTNWNGNIIESPTAGSVSVTAGTPNVIINPSPGVGNFTVATTAPIRANVSTSDPLVAADNTKVVTESNASPIAVSLAQAGTTGFGTGWSTCPLNTGAGAVTITPTVSTILGQASLLIPTNVMACILSNATNYLGIIGVPPYPGTSNTFLRGDGGFQIVDMAQVSGVLGFARGGTGQSSFSDGQVLIGNTATGGLSKATITAGSNVTVTNGSGSITIAASGGSPQQMLSFNSNGTATSSNSTQFVGSGISATEGDLQVISALSGTFKNLYFNASAAPSAGQTFITTLRVNGTDSSVTCTVSGGSATACNDVAHTVTITPGQTYDLKVVSSASAATAKVGWAVEFDPGVVGCTGTGLDFSVACNSQYLPALAL